MELVPLLIVMVMFTKANSLWKERKMAMDKKKAMDYFKEGSG